MIHQAVYGRDVNNQMYKIYYVHATEENYKLRILALILSKNTFEGKELFKVIREVEKISFEPLKLINMHGIEFAVSDLSDALI